MTDKEIMNQQLKRMDDFCKVLAEETPREEKSRVDAEMYLQDCRQSWRDMKGGY